MCIVAIALTNIARDVRCVPVVLQFPTTHNCLFRQVRMTADDLNSLRIAQENFNTLYRSDIVTEFAFNGIGILNQVRFGY